MGKIRLSYSLKNTLWPFFWKSFNYLKTADLFREDNLLLISKFPTVSGPFLIDLRRMKVCVKHKTTQRCWIRESSISIPALLPLGTYHCFNTKSSCTHRYDWETVKNLKLKRMLLWSFCFRFSFSKVAFKPTLREKFPNMEFFLVCIFLYSDWIRRFSP